MVSGRQVAHECIGLARGECQKGGGEVFGCNESFTEALLPQVLLGGITRHHPDARAPQLLQAIDGLRVDPLDDHHGHPQIGLGEGQILPALRGRRQAGQDIQLPVARLLEHRWPRLVGRRHEADAQPVLQQLEIRAG